ncbi:cell wall-binding repeat-containing protein [Euzebya sp.]|uniref:cell wall-binding repeat-containing protein n=1 Tax=Euzebya sp. TaxID=1971409 RepID=UPI0035150353
MQTRRTRLIMLATLAVAMLGITVPAGSAEPSTAEVMLAAGAGQDFSPAVTAGGFAAENCWDDPTDDVINLEDENASIDEDRGDIVEHCANYAGDSLMLSAEVAEPTDPETDVNWESSQLGWFIDANGDDSGEFFAKLYTDADTGEVVAGVEDRLEGEPAEDIECDVDWDYADGVLSVTLAADCIGSEQSVAVSPGLIYDQRVEDLNGVATFDSAPNGGGFEGELDAGGLPEGITRLGGDERIETSVLISQQAYPNGADAVVLARQDVFADAVTGTPLAIELDAPILLTTTDALSPAADTEIDRLLDTGDPVYLLGGTAAISEEVESELTTLGYDVIRYGGSNRFETAVVIAEEGLNSPTEVLAADGGSFQDALVAGPAAATVDGAVLLTDGETVPPATADYLATEGVDVTAIGETAAAALPEADSVAGADAVNTSVLVAETYFPDATAVGLARVDEFADALTGGALIGQVPGPVLFVETDSLPMVVEEYLTDQDITSVAIFGGTTAVSQEVEDAIEDAIS